MSSVTNKAATPALSGIDHIHVYTKDRPAAQAWYARVLGCTAVGEYAEWAEDGGPLVIENEAANIHLALFERKDCKASEIGAFGATAEQFVQWVTHLEDAGLNLRIADHDLAVSLYFQDPDQNGYEITTYERDAVLPQVTLS